MAKNYYDITLALAGINQAAGLVQQLAHDGQCNNQALSASLNSIIKIDAPSTLAVFGQEQDLKLGLENVVSLLSGSTQKIGPELMRYSAGIMILERKLSANNGILNTLSARIGQLDRQLAHFDISSETVIGAIADIYTEVISPLGPRIQVTGSAEALQQPLVQAKVRAALLAGVRAAVLWRQIGGSRLQLLFSRGHLINEAQTILAKI